MPKQNSGEALAADQIAAYLDRIGYRGSIDVSFEALKGLHRAHLFSVPFENLDIGLGRPISLEMGRIYDKVVTNRRGGYCYELNGLFAALLRGIGFSVDLLSAEVAMAAGGFSPAFDHLTLVVYLAQPWLADVGFGDSFLAPIPLAGAENGTADEAGLFRVWPDSTSMEMQQWRDDAWRPQYRFDLTPHPLKDFAERNVHQQTSPDSHFTQGRICWLARPNGRISLSNLRLITTEDRQRTERELSGDDEYHEVLSDVFGIDLNRTGAAGGA